MESMMNNILRAVRSTPAEDGDFQDIPTDDMEAELQRALDNSIDAVREVNESFSAPPPARLKESPPRDLVVQNPVQRRIETLLRDSSRATTRVSKIKTDGALRRSELVKELEELTSRLTLLEEELREHDRSVEDQVNHQLLLKQANDDAVTSLRSGLGKTKEL